MKTITKTQLNKALYLAVMKSYYAEIVKKTPGRGIVADGWDIRQEENSIIIFNKEFGDIILYLEEGTKAHDIKPKNKKALQWKIGPGDKFAYAKKVRHPGFEARKIIYNVLMDSNTEKKFELEFEKELKNIF